MRSTRRTRPPASSEVMTVITVQGHSNTDAAHEASESPARAAEEAAAHPALATK